MHRRALISDIHSNIEALDAVLEDIASQFVTEIYCLGDVVGYGPNPAQCIDHAFAFDVCLRGNHDQAVIAEAHDFNEGARRSIEWTRQVLSRSPGADRYFSFLRSLPLKHVDGCNIFVHGSVRDPLFEYVFPEDTYNQRKMEQIFSLVQKYCFQGHTHVPGVFTESLSFFSPEEINYEYCLPDGKVMVNVGSVGQPRDGDARACYVILDHDAVTFRRVAYDYDKTIRKIRRLG